MVMRLFTVYVMALVLFVNTVGALPQLPFDENLYRKTLVMVQAAKKIGNSIAGQRLSSEDLEKLSFPQLASLIADVVEGNPEISFKRKIEIRPLYLVLVSVVLACGSFGIGYVLMLRKIIRNLPPVLGYLDVAVDETCPVCLNHFDDEVARCGNIHNRGIACQAKFHHFCLEGVRAAARNPEEREVATDFGLIRLPAPLREPLCPTCRGPLRDYLIQRYGVNHILA